MSRETKAMLQALVRKQAAELRRARLRVGELEKLITEERETRRDHLLRTEGAFRAAFKSLQQTEEVLCGKTLDGATLRFK